MKITLRLIKHLKKAKFIVSHFKLFLNACVIYTALKGCVIKVGGSQIYYVYSKDGKSGFFEILETANPKIHKEENERAQEEEAATATSNVSGGNQKYIKSLSSLFDTMKRKYNENNAAIEEAVKKGAKISKTCFKSSIGLFKDFSNTSEMEFEPFFEKVVAAEIENLKYEQENCQSDFRKKKMENVQFIIKHLDFESKIIEDSNLFMKSYLMLVKYIYSLERTGYGEKQIIVSSGLEFKATNFELRPLSYLLGVKGELFPLLYGNFDNEMHIVLLIIDDDINVCGMIKAMVKYRKDIWT